jgi:hypothetical protein
MVEFLMSRLVGVSAFLAGAAVVLPKRFFGAVAFGRPATGYLITSAASAVAATTGHAFVAGRY